MRKNIKHIILIFLLLISGLSHSQIWKIGDIIKNPDGSKGIVFWENPDGTGGWMVSFFEYENIQWSPGEQKIPGTSYKRNLEAAHSDTAGSPNTALIRAFQGTGTQTAAQLVDFENGWYLPAAGQLHQLYAMLPFIEPIIKANLGQGFAEDVYWSSTESNTVAAYYYSFQNGRITNSYKNKFARVRSVRAFTNQPHPQDTTINYQWNTGETIPNITKKTSTTTIYSVTASSNNGCSTKASKQIFVSSNVNNVIYDTIRRGEIYNKHGFHESNSGTYTHTLSGASGCDINVTLHLMVLEPIPPTVFTEAICSGSIYSKHNFSAWEAGTYTQKWQTAHGNDSTVILNLTLNQSYEQTIKASVCQSKAYTGYGFNESKAGIYRKTLTTMSGCDSTIILHLGINPVYNYTLPATICEGETYTKNGFNESVAGIYTLNLQSKYGCDSTVKLLLDKSPISKDTIDATIYEGSAYTKNGFNESMPGLYTHTHSNQHGCDSLVTLRLKVLPLTDTIHASICKGETYSENGFSESAAGVYSRSFINSSGQKKNLALKLKVNPVYQKIIEASICHGETYIENGFNESVAGIYTLDLQSKYGCDSTVRLVLDKSPISKDTIDATIYEGSAYTKNGFNESMPGLYTHTHSNHYGCDSLVTLRLKVLPLTDTIHASICEGEIYSENGFSVAVAGIYTRSFINSSGQNATMVLNLKVNPVYQKIIEASICQGETYTENGFNESVANTYTHNLKTALGCDSIVILILNELAIYDVVIYDTICDGDTYTKNGFTVNQAGTYVQNLNTVTGCDSTTTLHLATHPIYNKVLMADICLGETYTENGFSESTTGTYTRTLESISGCDSILTLQLTVHEAKNTKFSATICQGETYTANGFNESAAGIYTRKLTSRFGCDSTVTLTLNVNNYFKGKIIYSLKDCAAHSYHFSTSNDIPADTAHYSYTWNFGDNTSSEEQELFHSYADSGKYEVTLLVKHGENCATELNTSVSVPYFTDQLEIFADRTIINSKFPEVKLWTIDFPGFTYHWNLGDQTTSSEPTVKHSYIINDEPYYEVSLTGTNSDECQVEKRLRIDIEKSIFIPNTFSPNNDGTNDVFMSGYHIRIVDRNGIIVFEGDNGWNGSGKNGQAQQDTYFYIIEYTTSQSKQTATGYITLFR